MEAMKLVTQPLSQDELKKMQKEYGDYIKITADIELGKAVFGCVLHADGESLLLEQSSKQDSIWGGGLNFISQEIDTTAVMNVRPTMGNNSLEILDEKRRNAYITLVKKLCKTIWGH